MWLRPRAVALATSLIVAASGAGGGAATSQAAARDDDQEVSFDEGGKRLGAGERAPADTTKIERRSRPGSGGA